MLRLPDEQTAFVHVTRSSLRWTMWRTFVAGSLAAWMLLIGGFGSIANNSSSPGMIAAGVMCVILYPGSLAFTVYGVVVDSRKVVGAGLLLFAGSTSCLGRLLASSLLARRSTDPVVTVGGVLSLLGSCMSWLMLCSQLSVPSIATLAASRGTALSRRFGRSGRTRKRQHRSGDVTIGIDNDPAELHVAKTDRHDQIRGLLHPLWAPVLTAVVGCVLLLSGAGVGINASGYDDEQAASGWLLFACTVATASSCTLVYMVFMSSSWDPATTYNNTTRKRFVFLAAGLYIGLLLGCGSTAFVSAGILSRCASPASATSNCTRSASTASILVCIGSTMLILSTTFFWTFLLVHGSVVDAASVGTQPGTPSSPRRESSLRSNPYASNGSSKQSEQVIDDPLHDMLLRWPSIQHVFKVSLLLVVIGWLAFFGSFIASASRQPAHITLIIVGAAVPFVARSWMQSGSKNALMALVGVLVLGCAASGGVFFSSASLTSGIASHAAGKLFGSLLFATGSIVMLVVLIGWLEPLVFWSPPWQVSVSLFAASPAGLIVYASGFGMTATAAGDVSNLDGGYAANGICAIIALVALSVVGIRTESVFDTTAHHHEWRLAMSVLQGIVLCVAGGAVFESLSAEGTVAIKAPEQLALQLTGSLLAACSCAFFAIHRVHTYTGVVSPAPIVATTPSAPGIRSALSGTPTLISRLKQALSPSQWWSSAWRDDRRFWDFEIHFLRVPSEMLKFGALSLLAVVGWIACFIIALGIGVASLSAQSPESPLAVLVFVSGSIALSSIYAFVFLGWRFTGLVVLGSCLATLALAGAASVDQLLFKPQPAASITVFGSLSVAFAVSFMISILVARPAAFAVDSRWLKALSSIAAFGWLVAVVGMAMSGGSPKFTAAPIIQYLGISFPGGVTWISLAYLYLWPSWQASLESAKQRRYKSKPASAATPQQTADATLKPAIGTPGWFQRFRRKAPPVQPPIAITTADATNAATDASASVHQPTADDQATPAEITPPPAMEEPRVLPPEVPNEEETALADPEIARQTATEEDASVPPPAQLTHAYAVFLCSISLLTSGATSLSGITTATLGTMVVFFGSLLMMAGFGGYIAFVFCGQRPEADLEEDSEHCTDETKDGKADDNPEDGSQELAPSQDSPDLMDRGQPVQDTREVRPDDSLKRPPNDGSTPGYAQAAPRVSVHFSPDVVVSRKDPTAGQSIPENGTDGGSQLFPSKDDNHGQPVEKDQPAPASLLLQVQGETGLSPTTEARAVDVIAMLQKRSNQHINAILSEDPQPATAEAEDKQTPLTLAALPTPAALPPLLPKPRDVFEIKQADEAAGSGGGDVEETHSTDDAADGRSRWLKKADNVSVSVEEMTAGE
ncbi:hypothetical protein BC831DRAFT_472342 [Entophlyctis helioformis]|nr:hypothetical protein BC831DRAFT_472342 [Entophlyctis helioformis]